MQYRQKLGDDVFSKVGEALKTLNISSPNDVGQIKERMYRKMASDAGVPYEMATRAFENLEREQAAALRRYQESITRASERLANELASLAVQLKNEDKNQ